MRWKRKKKFTRDVEEIVGMEWTTDHDLREVPLTRMPFYFVGILAIFISVICGMRLGYLNISSGSFYSALAESNMTETAKEEAPRGIISDRFGRVLAENTPTWKVILDVGKFIADDSVSQTKTFNAIDHVLGISSDMVSQLLDAQSAGSDPVPLMLSDKVTLDKALTLEGYDMPAIKVDQGFLREYPDAPIFSQVVGYTGFVGAGDIARNPILTYRDLTGKSGIELEYDMKLQGRPGMLVTDRNARGNTLGTHEAQAPAIGHPVRLTLDGDFQTYFYNRLAQGLMSLGRDVGVGVAMNPQNGQILALVQIPSYNANTLSSPGHGDEKAAILSSPLSPLFDRAIGGQYSPGSTIKPIVGIAALAEGIITPQKELFSPGYLDVPNPYDPANPTRYLDWRYQGYINMASAIAQSSDVYFYAVGGGAFDVKGLGIEHLNEWWRKFGLGTSTKIDLPGEKSGFLPTPAWKEKTTRRPWLLGDTYNISIGQGDLLLTPLQILNYTAAIGANGKMYKPTLNLDASSTLIADFSNLSSAIQVVQVGLTDGVTSPLGTSYALHDLPFSVAAKTGSAQVLNNTQENAFFVGYAPAANPQIAVLVLIEHSKEGSLNAVPIAKDVLNWYYTNRIKK